MSVVDAYSMCLDLSPCKYTLEENCWRSLSDDSAKKQTHLFTEAITWKGNRCNVIS